MIKTCKFKLYASKRNRKLHHQIRAAGLAYNHCIALHKRYYRLYHKFLNVFHLQKHLTKLKRIPKFSYLKELGSQALQNVAERIDKGYKLFFRNLELGIKTSPPKFKKVRKYKSFTLKQAGWKLNEKENCITINKQKYRYFKSRELLGKVKTLTVKRDSLGDVYILFSCEVQENEALARTGKSVGFDFGFKKFLTGSEEVADVISPEFFKESLSKIRWANRVRSRKKKGSKNYRNACVRLAQLHKKIRNRRSEFHWKLAQSFVGEYALICVEDLNLKGMQKRYGRKIMDLGFYEFLLKLEYMAKRVGSKVVKVGRFYPSSQLCHACGFQNKETKNLRIREWTCPQCGMHHDRDRNAAKNILAEGERIFAKC